MKRMMTMFLFLAVMTMTSFALAQAPDAVVASDAATLSSAVSISDALTVVDSDGDAFTAVGLLVDAVKSKNWSLFAGLFVMLALYLMGRLTNLREAVGAKAWPWVGASLAIATTIASSLVVGMPWNEALIQGFIGGAAATGLWEMLGKHILPKKDA